MNKVTTIIVITIVVLGSLFAYMYSRNNIEEVVDQDSGEIVKNDGIKYSPIPDDATDEEIRDILAEDAPVDVIVLSSLADARRKAQDAAIIATLANMRSIMDIYYEDNGGYEGGCESKDATLTFEEMREIKDLPRGCFDNTSGFTAFAVTNARELWCTNESGEIGVVSNIPTENATCKFTE